MRTRLSLLLLLAATGCNEGIQVPDVPDMPWSQDQPVRGVAFVCSTKTGQPDGETVEYQFDWGDVSQSEWSGPMPEGVAYGDTHTYEYAGPVRVHARARNSAGEVTDWSEPLELEVNSGEGRVRWAFCYADALNPADSAGFGSNTFAIANGAAYVGTDIGRLIALEPTGTRSWLFPGRGLEPGFASAPAVGPDGTLYIGCRNDTLYAMESGGTLKWARGLEAPISAAPALSQDGVVFVQTEGQWVHGFDSEGNQLWVSQVPAGGRSAPVVGPNGTVYAATSDGMLYAMNPADGTEKGRYQVGSGSISAAPAIDVANNAIYVVDQTGRLASLDLDGLILNWEQDAGTGPSSPVVGEDGTVFVGGGGALHALEPADGSVKWTFSPGLVGTVSTPAVSDSGYIYVLVSPGPGGQDSLYGLNLDGTRRWATGLGLCTGAEYGLSAPKIAEDGSIYVGSGRAGWCVVGLGGPARSSWPMFQRDGANSGRAQ